jgi:hypothetical protein
MATSIIEKHRMTSEDGPPVVVGPTMSQNETIDTLLSRLLHSELQFTVFQRDADQWDEIKKSLFIESVLNKLTVPAFYLAASEKNPEFQEVIDGQERLTTLNAFYSNEFRLCSSDICPYFGDSAHYAGKTYEELAEGWQRTFRRYNLTLVLLPPDMETSLRLEVFRRINDGGTPLSGQDIRLGYYSESKAVRYIQTVGIFDPQSAGSKRMLADLAIKSHIRVIDNKLPTNWNRDFVLFTRCS